MKKIKLWVLITISILFTTYISTGYLSFLDNSVHDAYLNNSGEITNDVVIIGIDNESIEKIGRFPWDREVYAQLIHNLTDGGAAAVGFDIIWSEEQENQDEILAEAIAESNDSVLLASYGELNGGLEEDSHALEADYFYYPNDILMSVDPSLGFINTQLDDDNVVRRALPYIYDAESGEYKTSFNYELYQIYAEKNDIPVDTLSKSYFDRPYINYYGSSGTIETIPFYQALDPEVIPPEYFENKIVLVGMTASGGEDIYYTPAGAMYGVEIHANFINNLILGNYKKPVADYNPIQVTENTAIDVSLLLEILLMSIIYIYMTMKVKSSIKKMIATGTITFIYIIYTLVLSELGYITHVVYPIMVFILLLIIDIVFDFFVEQREKKKVTDLFSRYMSKELVKKVIAEGTENIKLGGVKKDISIMFIDIRGFTTISEQMEPEEVTDIINEYLAVSTECIFDNKGILDKYTGDGLMALFNAPYDIENPELSCVKAAFEIRKNAESIHDKLFDRYGKSVRFGIGINCGDAIVGNIGSVTRMDYTAIGDSVNTAARLESNAKAGQILISEKVYNRIKEHVKVEEVGALKLKGKEQAILTYNVLEVL